MLRRKSIRLVVWIRFVLLRLLDLLYIRHAPLVH